MAWTGVRGKRVLITGASRGIGLAAARELTRRGAALTITARSDQRGQAAAGAIGGEVDVLIADLSSQESVRHLAAEVLARYPRLDVLINNAGAVNSRRRLTGDGLELTWAVNHLAPFLLTELLIERLRASAPARVITTAPMRIRAPPPFPLTTSRGSGHMAPTDSGAMPRPSWPTSSSRATSPAV